MTGKGFGVKGELAERTGLIIVIKLIKNFREIYSKRNLSYCLLSVGDVTS